MRLEIMQLPEPVDGVFGLLLQLIKRRLICTQRHGSVSLDSVNCTGFYSTAAPRPTKSLKFDQALIMISSQPERPGLFSDNPVAANWLA